VQGLKHSGAVNDVLVTYHAQSTITSLHRVLLFFPVLHLFVCLCLCFVFVFVCFVFVFGFVCVYLQLLVICIVFCLSINTHLMKLCVCVDVCADLCVGVCTGVCVGVGVLGMCACQAVLLAFGCSCTRC